MATKQETLGQYFTKKEIVEKLLDLLFSYKAYSKSTSILEPSSGTGNFTDCLKGKGFKNIKECEIDPELTTNPTDFFDLALDNKFDLIIGNPPFSKYNVKDSYYDLKKYLKNQTPPNSYLIKDIVKKGKDRIENVFILKSIKHLKNANSTIAFVLPISFFIKNRNRRIKETLLKNFSTVIIYQNDKIWFERNIPCCFLILSDIKKFEGKIINIFQNGKKNEEVFDIKNIYEELIPQVIFHKNNGYIKNEKGVPLSEFLADKKVHIRKSFTENNVSAKNILDKSKIPSNSKVKNFKMAVVRVGNSSVGKCGLVDQEKDTLNDMFYVFDFKNEYTNNKGLKEKLCDQINNNVDYFRNITCRVGSKSIKKEDILNFQVCI
ncbi:MAG: N-6 DNA methylase [Patescibacteria group bacterium]|jgi:hypothetical protein